MDQYTIKQIPIDWEKHHRYMPYSGWCGVTTIFIKERA